MVFLVGLGEKGRRMRDLTSVVQKRFNAPENNVELYAEKVNNRGLCAIALAESLRYKLLGGHAVRRFELSIHCANKNQFFLYPCNKMSSICFSFLSDLFFEVLLGCVILTAHRFFVPFLMPFRAFYLLGSH